MSKTKNDDSLAGTPAGNADEINELLRRYGVKFGIYKNGIFNEQFFPFDPIPRSNKRRAFCVDLKKVLFNVLLH